MPKIVEQGCIFVCLLSCSNAARKEFTISTRQSHRYPKTPHRSSRNCHTVRSEIFTPFGRILQVEISESLYEAFDEFELEDISHLNQVSRYQEQSELTEVSLHSRAIDMPESLEEQVHQKILQDKLHRAIGKLPEVQRRRLMLYYFGGYTYQQIAEMEGCKHPAIMKSVAAAEKKLKKYF